MKSDRKNDPALVDQILAGDPHDFDELHARYRNRIFRSRTAAREQPGRSRPTAGC
jgi:hypothetical protein